MRRCTRCGNLYPLTSEYFRRDIRYTKGLTRICIFCLRAYGRMHNEKVRHTEKGKERHRRDSALYRQRHPKRVKEQRKRNHEKWRLIHLQRMKAYTGTVNGYLRCVYGDINRRCNNPIGRNKCYKNINNLFKTSDEFVDYVMNELKVDPRKKQIHRINNNGHYERGNIEFLTAKEHRQKHRKVR